MKTVLVTSIGCAPASIVARTLRATGAYRVVGIDIQSECVGTFITDVYVQCPRITSPTYWPFIETLVRTHAIQFVFVTNNLETLPWSIQKSSLPCTVFLNDPPIVALMDDKESTVAWCRANGIRVPDLVDRTYRPCVIKPVAGAGSSGVQFLKTESDTPTSQGLCQRYIDGPEYTIDVLSDPSGRVVSVVPKERLLVKHGQSFKSRVCLDSDLIAFATTICERLRSKYVINIQVIRERTTGHLYLIEMNPRWATTVGLTIAAGANFPVMLLEGTYTPPTVTPNLLMIRDSAEYFLPT